MFKKIKSLASHLIQSAEKVINFFESKLQNNNSYGSNINDIACYFKSPMMFLVANKSTAANMILNYIKKSFMTKEGDFKTSDQLKSANIAYIEYWSYINGWILRAANLLKRNDILEKGYHYLSSYNLGKKSGFSTNEINKEPKMTDVLTIAHHG